MIGVEAVVQQGVEGGIEDVAAVIKTHLRESVISSIKSFSSMMELFQDQMEGVIDECMGIYGVSHISADYFTRTVSDVGFTLNLEKKIGKRVKELRDALIDGFYQEVEEHCTTVENYRKELLESIEKSIEGIKEGMPAVLNQKQQEFLSKKGW